MGDDQLRWFTSSFSGGNGNGCVEVAFGWFTSSFSGGNGNTCVEVAFDQRAVAVRDTKDRSMTPHRHSAAAWTEFLTAVRAREFA